MKTNFIHSKRLIITALLVLAGHVGTVAQAAPTDVSAYQLPSQSASIVDQHAQRAEIASTSSSALSLKIFQRHIVQALQNSRWSIGAKPANFSTPPQPQHMDAKRPGTSIMPMPTYDGGLFVEVEVAF